VTAYLQGGLEAEGPSSEQAANDFRRATELDPQLDLAWPALAKTLLALEAEKTANDADSDFRQVAASAFHRALQAHTGYQVMADTLLEVGYLDELAATLNDDHQPDDDITAIRFRVARALIPRNTKRDVATALETLKHIPKIDAPGAPNARLYGRVLHALQQGENAQPCADAVWEFLQGGMAVNNTQAVQAVEHYRRATALDPHLDVAWHALGRVLVAQNDLKAAGPVFQHVVDANPGDAIIYSHLADAVARGGDAKRALEATDTLLRGIGAMERKDYEGLRAAVEDALRQDDTYGLAHLVRGVFVDFREGREAGLIDAMHRAFALDATVAHYWKPFFTALLETKDYTVARNELHRLEKLGIPPPEPLVERLRTASGHKQ
jgi:tetratricopeptide (TPR) repeat protein